MLPIHSTKGLHLRFRPQLHQPLPDFPGIISLVVLDVQDPEMGIDHRLLLRSDDCTGFIRVYFGIDFKELDLELVDEVVRLLLDHLVVGDKGGYRLTERGEVT